MNHTPLKDILSITKALADAQRVRIVMLLATGELCVCQIVGVLKLAASTTSKHLSILSAAGLVSCRKDGRWAYYRLEKQTTVMRWLQQSLKDDPDLRADASALTKIKKQDLEILCRQQRPA